jgi:hypothetical protein
VEKRQIIVLDTPQETKLYIEEDHVSFEPCTPEEAEKFTISQQRMVIKLAQQLNKPVSYQELYAAYTGHPDPASSQRIYRMKKNFPATIRAAIKTKHGKGYVLAGTPVTNSTQAAELPEISIKKAPMPAIPCRNVWRFRIVLLDDVSECLELLKEAIYRLCSTETRYEVDVYLCDSCFDVMQQTNTSDVDVYVLDVARKSRNGGSLNEFHYFGYAFFKLLVEERPNALMKTKVIFYSRLSADIVSKEYRGMISDGQATFSHATLPEVEYFTKQQHSHSDVATYIKKYLDTLYEKENASSGKL